MLDQGLALARIDGERMSGSSIIGFEETLRSEVTCEMSGGSLKLLSELMTLAPINLTQVLSARGPLTQQEMHCFELALDASHPLVDLGFLLE